MLSASIIRRFSGAAYRFVGADQGNIAVIFAIALVPLISFMGAAIDYSRANRARSSMQSALDSTALMVSKDLSSGLITTSEINAKAQAYFAALYTDPEAQGVTVSATYTASNGSMGSTVQVTGSAYITTDFMNIAGFPTLDFSTNSTAAWGNTRMRVALALDNTGSMSQDGKLTALQSAVAGSGGLIDQLSALAKNSGDVYISVVPFAKVVNVGASNYSQTWIDWSDWQNPPTQQSTITVSLPSNWSSIGPGSTCPFPNSTLNANFYCTVGPVNASAKTSTIPSSGTYKGYICPGVDGSTHSLYNGCWNSVALGGGQFSHTWIPNAQSTWTGCVTDRTQTYDAQNTTPTTSNTATLFPANQYYENSQAYCKPGNSPLLQPIMPLSYDWTALKSMINAMQPTGGTDQPIGLAWAWESLLQTSPMNAPAEDPNYNYVHAIILLSDGLNTEDRWPAYGNGSQQFNGSIDARQKALCDNIKGVLDPKTGKPMYTIYTIQVNTSSPPDPTSPVLSYCASSPDKFYLLYSATQVISAFNSIGTSLSQLRVAR